MKFGQARLGVKIARAHDIQGRPGYPKTQTLSYHQTRPARF